MPKPPPKTAFPHYFDREDELQDYAETASQFPNAAPKTVKKFTAKKWEQHWDAKKRCAPPELTKNKFIDEMDWDCFQEQSGGEEMTILRYDLWRAIDRAAEVFPLPIVLAACESISVGEAAMGVQMRTKDICSQVKDAKLLLQQLLIDYRSEDASSPLNSN